MHPVGASNHCCSYWISVATFFKMQTLFFCHKPKFILSECFLALPVPGWSLVFLLFLTESTSEGFISSSLYYSCTLTYPAPFLDFVRYSSSAAILVTMSLFWESSPFKAFVEKDWALWERGHFMISHPRVNCCPMSHKYFASSERILSYSFGSSCWALAAVLWWEDHGW